MFCEVIPHVLDFRFPVYKEIFFYLVLYTIKYHIHCLGDFFLTVVENIPSAAELCVFIGVVGWEKPSSLRLIQRGIDFFLLWKILPTSTLAAEEESTTCLSILYYMWIGIFFGVVGVEILYGCMDER